MLDMIAKTAFGVEEPQKETIGQITLSERPDRAFVAVAARLGQEEALATALAEGLVSAPAPGKSTLGDSSLHWMGPDQFLYECAYSAPLAADRAVRDVTGALASVTDQSDGFVRFDLEGETALDLLQRLCALDVETMQTGDFSRTVIHHTGCFLSCRAVGTGFALYVPRSYAVSFWHALCEVAQGL